MYNPQKLHELCMLRLEGISWNLDSPAFQRLGGKIVKTMNRLNDAVLEVPTYNAGNYKR